MGLQTGYKSIGSAGKTVDGREIRPEWIQEAVETYDPNLYTAVLNFNHWPAKYFGSYGKVLGLKKGTSVENAISALANIEPNSRLTALSKEEVLFSSMEIDTDFRGSGKCYLVGLAVTPSPASVGTEQLKFASELDRFGSEVFFESNPSKTQFQATDYVRMDFSEIHKNMEEPDEKKFTSWLKKLINLDKETESEEETSMSNDNKKIEELQNEVSSLASAVNKLINKDDGNTPDNTNFSGDPNQLVEALAPQLEKFGIKISADKPKTDSEKIDELATKLENFMNKFDNADTNEATEKTEGDDQLVQLQNQVSQLANTINLAINGEQDSTPSGDQIQNDGTNDLV